MPKLIRPLSMALAAAGMTIAMPAAAAAPHATPTSSAAALSTSQIAPGAHIRIVEGQVLDHHKRGHRNNKHKRKHRHQARYYDDRHYYGESRYRDERPYYMRYDRNWGQPVYRDTRIWRGRDNRYYCRKEDGTTGLLVGAGVGALIGHELAGRGGDRTLGAILGGAAGALLGRSIDRFSTRCG